MLSSPPPRFAAWISACAAPSRSPRLRDDTPRSSSPSTIDESPSLQIRKTSPGCASTENASTSTSGSVPSARVITERCGCTSASPGDSSPRRTSSATSEWSSVSCSSVPSAQEVGARVADVAERDACRRARRARPSSSCPCPDGRGVVGRALVHAAVRLLDQLARRARSPPPVGADSPRARRRRAPTRPRRPARRPCRRRPRRAAARRRTRPRSAGASGPVSVSPACLRRVLTARTSGRSRRSGRRRRASACARASGDAVHERAVRRADVLDVDAVAARLEARMARRGVLVVGQRHVVVRGRGRPSAGASRAEDVALARAPGSRATTSRPSSRAAAAGQPGGSGLLRREDHRLLRQRAGRARPSGRSAR